MNWDQVEGQWLQLKGQVKAKWGKITDDELTTIAGKKDQLVGKLQEHYGIVKDDAERELDSWVASTKIDQIKDDSKKRVDQIKTNTQKRVDHVKENAKKM
ncbi:MAG: CsbD family protein [Deltaproteobacteria bacterium]|nr:CsbD family protein [Deltaproteobacteria bacterium]